MDALSGNIFGEDDENGTPVTSVDDLRALKKLFEFFDTDNDGSISIVELGNAIRSIGHNPSPEVIENLFGDIAKDERGGICFNDFMGIMTSHVALEVEEEYTQELLHHFSLFDKDLSGYIEVKTLKKVLSQKGDPLPKDEINEMVSLCKVTPDGFINYKELVAFVQKSSAAVNHQQNHGVVVLLILLLSVLG
eukprot:m.108766 g.108766  ORF g.108766 m.108766 type:complete len:192 (+) comp9196_c0_seq1:151-726(+)